MKEFLNSDALAKQMEASRKWQAYRKEHKIEALQLQGVLSEPEMKTLLRTVSEKKNSEVYTLKPVTTQSGDTAFFSVDQIALGADIVLGADSKTIALSLIARNLEEPHVEGGETVHVTIQDGQSVLIGGKVASEKYLLMAVTAVIVDPSGMKINEGAAPDSSTQGQ